MVLVFYWIQKKSIFEFSEKFPGWNLVKTDVLVSLIFAHLNKKFAFNWNLCFNYFDVPGVLSHSMQRSGLCRMSY